MEPSHIDNPGIFRTLTYLKLDTYSKLSQIFVKMECFAKTLYNYYSKALYIRSLTEFWIRPSLNKCSWTWRVTSRYVLYEIKNIREFSSLTFLMRHIQNYRKLWYIQSLIYSVILTSFLSMFSHIMAFRNFPYSEFWRV